MHDNIKGILLAAISAASFGTLAIFTKLAYALGATPSTILIFRFFFASIFLWAFCLMQRRTVPLSARQILILLLLGALGYGMMSYFFFLSVAMIPASMAGLLLYTYPVLVTIFAHLIGDETIDTVKTGALILASTGLVLVLGVSFQTTSNQGMAYALGSALVYSIFIVLSNRVLQSLNPILTTAYVAAGGFIAHLALGVFNHQINIMLPAQVWVHILAIALIPTVLAFIAFYRSIQIIGPSRASIVSTLEPVVTAILAAILFEERLGLYQIMGGLIILSAIVILQLRTQKSNLHMHENNVQTDDHFLASP